MNTTNRIRGEFKKIYNDIAFIELRQNDNAFSFLDKNIVVPIYIPSIQKNKENESISIKLSDVIFGIGLISYDKNVESLKEFLERTLNNSKDVINQIEQKKDIDPIAHYVYLKGLYKAVKEIEVDEETGIEVLKLLSIHERFILENYEFDDANEIINEYREHLSNIYEKTKDGKYIYYLAKSYEAEGDTLRARLLYTKGLEESNKTSNDWEEVKEALDIAYKAIFEKSEMERAAYLLSYNKYEEAIEIIDKLPESKERTKLKINALYNMGENEQILNEINRYEQEHGVDDELEAIKEII